MFHSFFESGQVPVRSSESGVFKSKTDIPGEDDMMPFRNTDHAPAMSENQYDKLKCRFCGDKSEPGFEDL